MNSGQILIVGVQPPPIGGVTMHVKRLCEHLKTTDLKWRFIDIRKKKQKDVLLSIVSHKTIHLHASNPYVRLFLSIFCYLTFRKIIVTFHGNIGRYGKLKNLMDIITIKCAYIPIVLNDNSYEIALKHNKRACIISAFIPEMNVVPLHQIISNNINKLRKVSRHIYCTNAYDVSFDKDGNEIYQISSLVGLFNKYQEHGLIISDPSGNYEKYLKDKNIHLHDNILLLPFEHDFNAIIQSTDCMIRFTTTDGDSISVKEALWNAKPVIATNVVPRPEGVILVNPNIGALEQLISNDDIMINRDPSIQPLPNNGAEELINLYKSIIQ